MRIECLLEPFGLPEDLVCDSNTLYAYVQLPCLTEIDRSAISNLTCNPAIKFNFENVKNTLKVLYISISVKRSSFEFI